MATLSYAADLGLGQPMEHCLRQTVIALRLADLVGANPAAREATYYLGLMMNVYCHADAAEQASWFGDDIAFKGRRLRGPRPEHAAGMMAFILRRVGSHGSRRRGPATGPVPGDRTEAAGRVPDPHSTLGAQFAERIGVDQAVCIAIRDAYEQWDGKGQPTHLRGDNISLPARLVSSPAQSRSSAATRGRGRAGGGPSAPRDHVRSACGRPVLRPRIRAARRS